MVIKCMIIIIIMIMIIIMIGVKDKLRHLPYVHSIQVGAIYRFK